MSEPRFFKSYRTLYTVLGAGFGFCFPIVATLLESAALSGGVTWANLVKVQSTDTLLWIIDSAPLFLGLFACLAGNHQDRLAETINSRETVILQRTAELSEAMQKAQSAARAKSAFLANMSHEIRTPMNGVIGIASILMETKLDDDQREYVETICASGNALLTLINDILDFSKIEAGRLELELAPLRIHECVEEALSLIAHKATEKGVAVGYCMDDNVPGMVEGDVTRLRQVLINLLGNAVKFTDEGSIHVKVGKRGDHIRFSVVDTGIGISEEYQQRVFESFTQVDASITRQYGGTGLGLAISQQLVRLMGGTMHLESAPDVGSTFHFTIKASPVIEAETSVQQYTHLAGQRLLIVDPHEFNHQILTQLGLQAGLLPISPPSATTGQDWLRHFPPFDFVLVDRAWYEEQGLGLDEVLAAQSPDVDLVLMEPIGQASLETAGDRVISGIVHKPLKRASVLQTLDGIAAKKQYRARELEHAEGLRVLIAEPAMLAQKTTKRFLDRLGYPSEAAASGAEVLDAVRSGRCDVLLLNAVFPDMLGCEVIQALNTYRGKGGHVRILGMITGDSRIEDTLYNAVQTGDLLTKPLQLSTLRRVLQSISVSKSVPGQG